MIDADLLDHARRIRRLDAFPGSSFEPPPDVLTVRAVTTTQALTADDDVVIATGTITLTLPTAVGAAGRTLVVKRVGASTVTIARPTGENIDGAASDITLSADGEARELVSDGTGWQIISDYL